jgi:hypothetical protein
VYAQYGIAVFKSIEMEIYDFPPLAMEKSARYFYLALSLKLF